MNSMVAKRKTCRLCDSSNLVCVLPMNPSPIAEAFVTHEQKNVEQPLFPLDLYQCQDCGHAQNLDIVDANILFRDYIFKTASSIGLIEHFRKYAKDVVEKLNIKPGSLVVEIGSNDGTLLRFFKELGMEVLGIDPALEISKEVTLSGITTLPEFFTSSLATEIKSKYGPAKLIIANNVFAHCDQLADMTDAISLLLDHDGLFIFEVSYLLDIIDNFVFDTIYHEHLSYHSIAPFKRFFKAHGLHLFDVQSISTKGGSIRGFVQKAEGARPEENIIEIMIENEKKRGLHELAIFSKYEHEINIRKKAVQDFVDKAIKNKQRVVAYGASNTVMTLMYNFELENKLEYLVDDNPRKHGLFSPGSHLEVKPSSVLYSDKPDVVIILAWQYATAICKKHTQFVAEGGLMVVPLPNLRIIEQLSTVAI